MACDPQTLLDTNPCLAAYPPWVVLVVEAQAWCYLAENATPGAPGNAWFSEDAGAPLYSEDSSGIIVDPDV